MSSLECSEKLSDRSDKIETSNFILTFRLLSYLKLKTFNLKLTSLNWKLETRPAVLLETPPSRWAGTQGFFRNVHKINSLCFGSLPELIVVGFCNRWSNVFPRGV
jgi:hypothetical protein